MFDEDRERLMQDMREQGVGGIIVGTDRTSSRQAVEMSDGENFFATVGLHPNDKPSEGYDDEYFRELSQDTKVVAIGECGLDYYRPENPETEKTRQKDSFQRQIELAGERGLPLMIHARPSKGSMDAYHDAYDMLVEAKKKYPNLTGNMHFYVGDIPTTDMFLSLGFTFSFTAVLTFTSDYDDVVRHIPLPNILTETDAPYVAPAPNRGKRNDPYAVRDVVKAIARIRGMGEEEVREATLGNARRVFGL